MKGSKKRYSFARKMISIILYLVNIAIVFFPWIEVNSSRYNIIQLRSQISQLGIDTFIEEHQLLVDNPAFTAFSIQIQNVFFYVFFVLCMLYILSVIANKNWYLNKAAIFAAVAIAIINSTGYSVAALSTNFVVGMCFPVILIVITVIEMVIAAYMDSAKRPKSR